jgi:3-methyladenine DNA glycosylase AlkD
VDRAEDQAIAQTDHSDAAPHPIVDGRILSETAADLERQLAALANPDDARFLQRYFKTGAGEYGEGDRFLGIRIPALRALVKPNQHIDLAQCRALLRSQWHEARMLALLILVRKYERGDAALRAKIFDLYLKNTARINNWDLIDLSAPNIVGRHLLSGNRAILTRLARSTSLWERRIAMLATAAFIKHDDFADTFRIADLLLTDDHDLIHKAVGWMLREVGKRDRAAAEEFLRSRYTRMPRTMLRYAIEKYPEPLRQRYLKGRTA